MLYILQNVPKYLQWPAHSPDLSPIEQVWGIIEKRLSGQRFGDVDDLFRAIEREWYTINDDTIHNLHSSFYARCLTCKEINGECLNTHWQKVHEIHNTYRTHLNYFTNPNTGRKIEFETS